MIVIYEILTKLQLHAGLLSTISQSSKNPFNKINVTLAMGHAVDFIAR